VHEVLLKYEVGHEFILVDFLTDMQERNWPQRNRTKRQPVGRVANILGEYVKANYLHRKAELHTSRSTFKVLRKVNFLM
jgi:hypothetical protein